MKKLLLGAGVGLALLVLPVMALATTDLGPYDAQQVNSGLPASQTSGLPPSQTSGSAGTVAGSGQVNNPLGVTSFCGLIKSLLSAAISIGIPIAVLFIVWAGLKFVLAMGKPEALKAARTNMLYTVIGIGVFLGASLLISVISNTVNALSSGSGQTISSCN